MNKETLKALKNFWEGDKLIETKNGNIARIDKGECAIYTPDKWTGNEGYIGRRLITIYKEDLSQKEFENLIEKLLKNF